MICQNCGQHKATICIVKIAKNKMEKKYICQACANKINNIDENLNQILTPFLGDLFAKDQNFKDVNDQICPTCGQSRRNWQEAGQFNCRDCYNFLDIDKEHIGKIPKKDKEELYLINIIKEKEKGLKKMIAEERYEEAAVLRDEIKGLKEGSEKNGE